MGDSSGSDDGGDGADMDPMEAYGGGPVQQTGPNAGKSPGFIDSFLGSTTPPDHAENDRRVGEAMSKMPNADGQREFQNVITGETDTVENYSRPSFPTRSGSITDFHSEPSVTISPLGVVGRVAALATGVGGIGGALLGTLGMSAGNAASKALGHGSINISPSKGITVDSGTAGQVGQSSESRRNEITLEDIRNAPEGLMAGKDPNRPTSGGVPVYDDPPDIDYGNDAPVTKKISSSKVSLLSPQQPNIDEEEVDPLAQARRRYAGQNSLMSSGYRGYT